MDIEDRVRKYWDVDAQTYDHSPSHVTATAAERAAWTAALSRHLAPGAKVLDAGAGTGFMSLLAARIGAQVTALDLSTGMLGRLEATASARGVSVAIV
jgi:cyclopropane fatty-acyl-phospholipid synthase-like methyltransferase